MLTAETKLSSMHRNVRTVHAICKKHLEMAEPAHSLYPPGHRWAQDPGRKVELLSVLGTGDKAAVQRERSKPGPNTVGHGTVLDHPSALEHKKGFSQ